MSAVRQHFAAIASVYDRANRVLSLGLDRSWRERAVRLLRGRCAAALDLACGTGDFSLAIARRFPGARVTGVDFTPEMLEIARGLGYEGSFMEVMRCRIHGNGALSPVPRHPFPSKGQR